MDSRLPKKGTYGSLYVMRIRSLGRRTDLIFSRFSGTVIDRGAYTLIQTPSNPEFHWGNFIVFDRAPNIGTFQEWKSIFDREFPYYSTPHHYSFTWDEDQMGNLSEFLAADFGYEVTRVLVATRRSLNPPRYLRDGLLIRKLTSDQDWSQSLELQIVCAAPEFSGPAYRTFKKAQNAEYRKMSEAGLGDWWGAFIGERLVGDLGVFFDENLGRYQNVGTHPEFRAQGICQTLVHEVAQRSFSERPDTQSLVIQADANYVASRIYESLGFNHQETLHSVSWWVSKSEG